MVRNTTPPQHTLLFLWLLTSTSVYHTIDVHPRVAVKYPYSSRAQANSRWSEGIWGIFPCCVSLFGMCFQVARSWYQQNLTSEHLGRFSRLRCLGADVSFPVCWLKGRSQHVRHASQMVFSSQKVCCRSACVRRRRSSPGTAGGLW